jgi:hypothetical protein
MAVSVAPSGEQGIFNLDGGRVDARAGFAAAAPSCVIIHDLDGSRVAATVASSMEQGFLPLD